MTATWQDEDRYWREHFHRRPYARGRRYEDLQSGYRFGYEAARQQTGRPWADMEPELRHQWDRSGDRQQGTWEEVKDAVRDAWDRFVAATFPTM